MISAYLKPTNYCNVGCDHCYLSEAVRSDRYRMTLETVAQTARVLCDMLARQGASSVLVIWHGGEPLLVPTAWYGDAGAILDDVLPSHEESIQTSLIPYDGSHADLIHRRFGGRVGTSIDFSTRTIQGSNEAYRSLWLLKVEKARSDGIWVVPGFVPSRGELGREREIVEFFVEHGFRDVSVERYNAFNGAHPARPSNAEHSAFLSSLLDVLIDRLRSGQPTPRVNVILASIRGVLLGKGGDRWGTRCQSEFVVVDPDGSLNTCPDKMSHENAYASVYSGYDGFRGSLPRRWWIRIQEAEHRNGHCASCDYHSWCRSGCPITPQYGEAGETECSGYRRYLDYLRVRLSNDSDFSLLCRYAGLAPGEREIHAG